MHFYCVLFHFRCRQTRESERPRMMSYPGSVIHNPSRQYIAWSVLQILSVNIPSGKTSDLIHYRLRIEHFNKNWFCFILVDYPSNTNSSHLIKSSNVDWFKSDEVLKRGRAMNSLLFSKLTQAWNYLMRLHIVEFLYHISSAAMPGWEPELSRLEMNACFDSYY